MLAKTKSYSLTGIKGYDVDVEVDISNGLPAYETVGLGDTAVKESRERIRASIKNSGLAYPVKRIVVNLAPADTKKEGPLFDLAIAVGILVASDQITTSTYKDYVIIGELSLDGTLRHVNGVMPILISAYQQGYTKFLIPKANENEAKYVEGIEAYPVSNLNEVVDMLNGTSTITPVEHTEYESRRVTNAYGVDFSEVKGQSIAKRALEIAVAGGHNVLMIGPPGAGKTMLAKCVPSIMPQMSFEEALTVTKIHSVAGALDEKTGIVLNRPFRTPHHTATTVALTGGGAHCRPGEISMAHNGVLFLDELPEYSRQSLEILRQPLEDGVISVSRAIGTVEYPARFMMIASMNPCPCGNYGSKKHPCTCTTQQIHKYLSKLSGPLLDRIDLHIEVDGVSYENLKDTTQLETSAQIKVRVDRARQIQADRYKDEGIFTNAAMTNRLIDKHCRISPAGEKLMQMAFDKLKLSARAGSRILKVARTIADIDGNENISEANIAEAIQYRSLDRKYYL
jgi:magnesium chelatase family protein